jgi:hypothetical protein
MATSQNAEGSPDQVWGRHFAVLRMTGPVQGRVSNQDDGATGPVGASLLYSPPPRS